MPLQFKFLPSGDSGLLIKFDELIDETVSRRVLTLSETLKNAHVPGVYDFVPAYCSLLILFDPRVIGFHELCNKVREISLQMASEYVASTRKVEIPLCYGGSFGPDLPEIASLHDLSQEQVIKEHSLNTYFVFFIGFCPGFPYMGKVPDSIATPRLARPRVRVSAGTVGIAGNQTGIYPIETPGGWRLIGRTPLKLFDPRRDPPNLLQAGDRVQFLPITSEEFKNIEEEIGHGHFQLRTLE